MTPPTDRLIATRQLQEPCARCHHTAGRHHLGQVRSWEYCLAPDCLCPGWCSTLDCATCDYGTPRWAGYSQCLGCLDYRVKPCDYVYKSIVGFDTDAARVAIQAHRQEWEVKHPGWHLDLDRQRLWPESAAPSRHADRQTVLGRKKYESRFRVVRAHPRRRSVDQIARRVLAYVNLQDRFDTQARILTHLIGGGPTRISGGRGIETPIIFAKDDSREEIAPGIYRTPLDWKSYTVSVPVAESGREEFAKIIAQQEQSLRENLAADLFADGWAGIQHGEERFDAICAHCGGLWEGLFPSEEEADRWLMQHRIMCLTLTPPPLVEGDHD